ncbi:efflux RND transporter periplasmic adaptor subunit [Nevskia sp.]|uniref:efflux RND transporter periplasmic adaptor subunit n=1 Tax=Nevskia sp. TaxID=1929292 RepID=UPI0025F1C99E|nr:efflux RND transporter periplasmic adaptor subunit [Nevskia sp.]
MNPSRILTGVALLAIALSAAWWFTRGPSTPPVVAERQPLYWYDPMVPDQKFDKPGKSPFMDMQLVPKYADDEAAPAATAAEAAATPAEREPLYWYDPMVPDQKFDKPGKSPFMDMQLVPKYADDEAAAASVAVSEAAAATGDSFRIDPRVVQNLGVRLATVERRALSQQVQAAGAIAVDEHGIEAQQVRVAGWVEKLNVRAVGDPVTRGQLLASINTPELFAAQSEFLLALRSGDAALKDAARTRLALFGVGEAQIARIATTGVAERRVDYFAPRDGYVMELGVRQGAMVSPGMTLFQIAGLDRVWLNAEVPEAQGAWIQPGDAAQASLSALPGERFDGTVEYLYPEVGGSTRTLRLRIALDNRSRRLRPGLYASVQLAGAARAPALTVPTEAVIRTGTRSVVLIADESSRFTPVLVRLGAEVGDRIEVLDGLSDGQQVVASGQFLIDSEASLRGALDRLSAVAPEAPAAGATTDADDPHAGHDGHAGHQGHAP